MNEPNRLIGDRPGASASLGRVYELDAHAAFGTGHKERARLVQFKELGKSPDSSDPSNATASTGTSSTLISPIEPALVYVNEGRDRAT